MPRILARPGLEVFVNRHATISIQQDHDPFVEDQLVTVHPDDVPRLIQMLQNAAADARSIPPEEIEAATSSAEEDRP